MKRSRILILATAIVFNFQFSIFNSAQAQPTPTTHYWSVGLESSTPFFFATYTPGGSNIFLLDGSYTHIVSRNWLLGGGLGIGGASSTKQVYRTDTPGATGFDTLATAQRNPYVIPVFLRARYLFDPSHKSTWFAGLDAGYMLGLVSSPADNLGTQNLKLKTFNYYSAYFTPTLGHTFGFTATRTRVSVGAGLNLYLEGREDETAPYDRHYQPHLNFVAFVTFDFGK